MNTTSSDTKMQPVDYMRSGALIVAFVALLFVDDNMWMLTEMIICASLALTMFFFNGTLQGYLTTLKQDSLNIYLNQTMGILWTGYALHFFYLRRSQDRNVRLALCMSRIITTIGWILVHITARQQSPQIFTQQHLTFALLGLSLSLFRNLFHLSRFASFGGGNKIPNDRFSKQMMVFMLMLILSFTLNLGFPEFTLQIGINSSAGGVKLTPLHSYQVQLLGCTSLGVLITCYSSFYFSNFSDRRAFVLSNIIVMCLFLPFMEISQYMYNLFQNHACWSNICLGGLSTVNLIIAYFYPGKAHED